MGSQAGRAGTGAQEGAPVRAGGGGARRAQGGHIQEQGLSGTNTPEWLEVGDLQGRGSCGDEAGVGSRGHLCRAAAGESRTFTVRGSLL